MPLSGKVRKDNTTHWDLLYGVVVIAVAVAPPLELRRYARRLSNTGCATSFDRANDCRHVGAAMP